MDLQLLQVVSFGDQLLDKHWVECLKLSPPIEFEFFKASGGHKLGDDADNVVGHPAVIIDFIDG